MIDVLCSPNAPAELLARANRPSAPYRFVTATAEPKVALEITHQELPAPFVPRGAGEAVITTHLAEEIAAYANIALPDYLLTIALCGVIQARALYLNPLLRPYDFRHRHPANCLMSERFVLEDYFELFEAPHLCRNCRQFLGELCPEEEVRALARCISALRDHGPMPLPA